MALSSSVSGKPTLELINSNTDADSPEIIFQKIATGADNDYVGMIKFDGKNDTDSGFINFARVFAQIADASDTDEAGTFNIQVACSDGSTSSLQTAFSATGGSPVSLQEEVNVNIGHGEFSQTNIAGSMTIGGAQVSGDSFGITANSPTTLCQAGATFSIKGFTR